MLLRFIGQVLRAKRDVNEQAKRKKRDQAVQNRKEFIKQNEGKVFVISPEKVDNSDVEDVNYKEVE
ncbi:MAG TPA: hypothetical protein PLP27_08885 [Crocinitomicaceae bacterium]|nr:hypothetical protein [Crocinitomicaceae bacterium]